MNFSARRTRLAAALTKARLPALLVTHLPDVRWLTGFTGSNAAVIVLRTGRGIRVRLFTDGRYTAQAAVEVQGATVRIAKKSALAEALAFVTASPVDCCGFDATTTSVATLGTLRKSLPDDGRRSSFLYSTVDILATLRQEKDAEEVAALRRAAALGCTLYEGMLSFIEAGMRERDVAAELENRARLSGAEAMSFETIVAGGVRSAMPHARATDAVLEPGMLLTLDFGILLDGYCSDMTRTVFLQPDAAKRQTAAFRERLQAQRRVFDAVLEAQLAAVDEVRAGTTAGTVDEAARGTLKRHALDKAFSHSTGHGLGLDIHEGPRIAAKQAAPLQQGMTITIEPGAYLPGSFGVRIEDTVLVTDTGCEILTPAFKGWVEL